MSMTWRQHWRNHGECQVWSVTVGGYEGEDGGGGLMVVWSVTVGGREVRGRRWWGWVNGCVVRHSGGKRGTRERMVGGGCQVWSVTVGGYEGEDGGGG